MPNFRQQAEELARQLTAAIAEARYWQLQAEQQIADEDRLARAAAESARKNALDAAARQRDAAVAALVAARDKELAAALAEYKGVLDLLPGKVDALTQALGYAAFAWSDQKQWDAWRPATSTHAPAALRAGELAIKGEWHTLKQPALLPLIGGRGALLFRAADKARPAAAHAVQSLAARLLATLPPPANSASPSSTPSAWGRMSPPS